MKAQPGKNNTSENNVPSLGREEPREEKSVSESLVGKKKKNTQKQQMWDKNVPWCFCPFQGSLQSGENKQPLNNFTRAEKNHSRQLKSSCFRVIKGPGPSDSRQNNSADFSQPYIVFLALMFTLESKFEARCTVKRVTLQFEGSVPPP